MTDPIATLQDLSLSFASDIGQTLRKVLGPQVPPLQLLVGPAHGPDAIKVVITHPPGVGGIGLFVDKKQVLRLEVNYRCAYDSSMRFPRVDQSTFNVFSKSSTEPLFRYDYLREPNSSIACAHINVHGHHDHVVWAMTQAGGRERGKRRARATASGVAPGLRELHFPLGGHRFRPCLEDVLEMLILEFGLDAEDGWREELAAGRVEWRRRQLAAAMKDDPETALRVAEELRDGHGVRSDRLKQL